MSRKIRILMAKVGLDGHDVGARVVARGLLEAGMEVVYTGIRRTPEQIARIAVDEDVDVVGISSLSGAHGVLVPKVRALLNEAGASDIKMIVGGVIPQEDIPDLLAIGVSKVFLSGTSVAEIAEYIQAEIDLGTEASL
jgi:methylmalonyl-CoA mutase C-terminal domain/subunit